MNRWVTGMMLTLLLGWTGAPHAWANGRTNDRYIGYQGVLEVNGQPINGAVALRVAIFANANDSTACLSAASSFFTSCGLFRQQLALTAVKGAFSAKVGPIQDATVLAPGRFLAVAVVQPTAIIPLQGMQEILPVWSAQGGEDFIVGRTLTVASTLNASGNVNAAGNVVVGGAGPAGVSSRLSVRRPDNATDPVAIFMPENNTQGVGITWQA